MTQGRITIPFYFDFISPYAYFAWKRCRADPSLPFGLEPRPVLFFALLKHFGQTGPADIPVKRNYVLHDVARRAKRLGIPFRTPTTTEHPFNPIIPLRVAGIETGEIQSRIIDALFTAYWGSGAAISSADEVAITLRAAGIPGEKDLVEKATSAEVKEALRTATDAAINLGVFGVPVFQVGPELFWGSDRITDVTEQILAPIA